MKGRLYIKRGGGHAVTVTMRTLRAARLAASEMRARGYEAWAWPCLKVETYLNASELAALTSGKRRAAALS